MAQKIKLDWKKYEIARVVHATLAVGTTVKVDGVECQIGDYLVRTSEGTQVVSSDEIEGIEWLDTDADEIPELTTEDETDE